MEEGDNPHLATTSFQVVVESDRWDKLQNIYFFQVVLSEFLTFQHTNFTPGHNLSFSRASVAHDISFITFLMPEVQYLFSAVLSSQFCFSVKSLNADLLKFFNINCTSSR